MSTHQAERGGPVGEREARQVAEEARLDLIHPHPRPGEESSRRGEEFCARLREFCEASVDGALIERDARIPDEVVRGLAAVGAFGMKVAPEYGGAGLSSL
jgi:alkylation response protein AidB-like acyl-CoA dehydrogenase